MFEWISSLFQTVMAELVFLSIAIGGGAFTIFSLLFGGEHDGHGDIGHTDISHDVGHGGDAHHAGDHAQDQQGPSFLSFRGFVLFATGFGSVGYLVEHFTHGMTLVASVAGACGGMVLAFVGIMTIRAFFHQQASSLVSANQAVGETGTVVTSIPVGGAGEVEFVLAGIQRTRSAISADNIPIARGRAVRILRVGGQHLVVEKVT